MANWYERIMPDEKPPWNLAGCFTILIWFIVSGECMLLGSYTRFCLVHNKGLESPTLKHPDMSQLLGLGQTVL